MTDQKFIDSKFFQKSIFDLVIFKKRKFGTGAEFELPYFTAVGHNVRRSKMADWTILRIPV